MCLLLVLIDYKCPLESITLCSSLSFLSEFVCYYKHAHTFTFSQAVIVHHVT